MGGLQCLCMYQLSWVMVLPQRGHMEPPEAQVVPQLEQVLTRQQVPAELAVGQETEPPDEVLTTDAEAFSGHTSVKAQDDWGKSGSEKNSSHTDSANSSQGGTSQKP